MKALVTGATGFVGKHLVHALRSGGIQACGLSSRDVDFTGEPSVVEARLAEIIEEQSPDVVFHLAGPKPYADSQTCERLCVTGTAALLSAVERFGSVPRIVAAGSSTEYGHSATLGHCLSESDAPHPPTPYGAAKLRQTLAILEAGGTALRLFNCIGPGQGDDLVAGRIVRQLAEGTRHLVLREIASHRDFLDVRDAAGAFVMAADSLPQGLYNVCSGVATRIDRLVEWAFEAAEIDPLPVEIEAPESEGSYQCGDPSKLESFGWRRRYSIVESLREAIEYERRRLSDSRRASNP